MTKGKSVLIVGAGHNGLICGTYLAKAGHNVTIIEARETIGGGIALRQFSDGYSAPTLAQMHHPLHAKIVKELKLGSPATTPERMETISLSPTGAHVILGSEQASGRDLSERDRAAYSEFMNEYASYAQALGTLYLNTPPRLKDFDLADAKTLTKLGLNLRFGLGRKDMREFLRIGGMNIYDVLNETFDSALLKGALAAQAVMGNHVGPRTPTTALNYLYSRHQELNGMPVAVAGTAKRLEAAAMTAGVDIKTNSAVKKINIENGRACGLELASGEQLQADLIVSNADAKTTFLDLVGPAELDALFVHRISKTRTNGDVSKVHLALKALPVFSNLDPADLHHRLLIAPSMRYVERAFNPSKYGEYSEHPVLDISIPSMSDPSLAPQGHHVMCINVSYTPYQLKAGWGQNRDALYQTVLNTLSEYAPGIADRVEDHEILTPLDIEREYGVTGGHWHHGEMSIDQGFMMRPVHGTAQYHTPIEGLFLCGAAAHPGGGITGLPGRNAARRILAKGGI